MKPRRRRSPCLTAVPSLLALAAYVVAAPALLAGEEDSPFLRQGTGSAPAAPANTALDTLELRGVMSIGGTTRVTLFDTARTKSFTIEVNETVNNWKVTGYNAADDTVTVESGGQSRRVPMRKPRILAAATPSAPPVPVAMPVPGQPQPGLQLQPPPQPPVVPGGQMSDEEAKRRLENVATEIQRRRQMRREMLERTQQPGQPSPGGQPVAPAP